MIVFKYTCQRGCHERLAQPDDVADEDAATLVQVVRGDLHGRGLEIEKFVAEVLGDAKLAQTASCFA